MGNSLRDIAKTLKEADKKVQLIYAFNGTGKTRLSREFRYLIVPKDESDRDEELDQVELARTKILYYNAFTEDLFYWDNDLEQDSEPKLKIQPNTFTDWVLNDQGQDQNVIANFQRYTDEKLTPHFSADFSEVTFSFERGNEDVSQNVKISKGEESNFVWSIFYTLVEQVLVVKNDPEEKSTNEFDQLEYIFIDDPVSSLDENHLIELAVNLSELINRSPLGLRFIISTHNPLFYNVLFNELGIKKKKGGYMLYKYEDGTYELTEKYGDSNKSFSYHLHLKMIIEQAIEANEVERYHFMLIRNLYEKTASFLGYPKWSDLLPSRGKDGYVKRIIQFSSHRTLSNEEIAEPTEPEKQTVKFLLDNLVNNYGFWQQGGQNG